MTYEKLRVLIAHDNDLVAAGLEAAFLKEEDCLAQRCHPIDLPASAVSMMPGTVIVTDYEAGMRLLSQHGRLWRILIVTDTDSELGVRRAVELGTRGYLPLNASVSAVVRAVRCIHAGGTAIDPMFISRIAVSLASPSLTNRELEVLQLMMEGLSNKGIALRLKRSVGTAKSHVKAILGKLDVATRVEAVAVAQRRGLLPRKSIAPSASVSRQSQPTWALPATAHPMQLMLSAED